MTKHSVWRKLGNQNKDGGGIVFGVEGTNISTTLAQQLRDGLNKHAPTAKGIPINFLGRKPVSHHETRKHLRLFVDPAHFRKQAERPDTGDKSGSDSRTIWLHEDAVRAIEEALKPLAEAPEPPKQKPPKSHAEKAAAKHRQRIVLGPKSKSDFIDF